MKVTYVSAIGVTTEAVADAEHATITKKNGQKIVVPVTIDHGELEDMRKKAHEAVDRLFDMHKGMQKQ